MPVSLAPFPLYVADTNNGYPLAGGMLDTFAAGTFTPLATYSDPAGATPNPNPVLLDASGRANIYFTVGSAYKLRQRDSTGVTLWTVDNFIVSPQGDPTLINDYSASVTQSEQTMDPGETGTEVLATSLAQELQQLRFVIKEMKGTPSWRTSGTFRHDTSPTSSSSIENVLWAPTGTTGYYFRFHVPDGWDPLTNITLSILRRFVAAGGTAKMVWMFSRFRDGTAPASSGNGVVDFVHVDGLSHILTLVLDQATVLYAAGDSLFVSVTRLGDDAGGTNTGAIQMDAAWFNYQGIASR